jgi:hypothetical protein
VILHRFTPYEIESQFTHYARFAGLVPCYFNAETHCIVTANWWPEVLLWLATGLYGAFIFTVSIVSEDYEPGWPITLTGETGPSLKGRL